MRGHIKIACECFQISDDLLTRGFAHGTHYPALLAHPPQNRAICSPYTRSPLPQIFSPCFRPGWFTAMDQSDRSDTIIAVQSANGKSSGLSVAVTPRSCFTSPVVSFSISHNSMSKVGQSTVSYIPATANQSAPHVSLQL